MYYIILTFILLCMATLVLNHLGYIKIFKTSNESTDDTFQKNGISNNNHRDENSIGFSFSSHVPWLFTQKKTNTMGPLIISNTNKHDGDNIEHPESKTKPNNNISTNNIITNNKELYNPTAPKEGSIIDGEHNNKKNSNDYNNIETNTDSKYAHFYNPTNHHLIIEKNLKN
ncbi:MAG: hypothetical protein [Cotesia congregata filamentous virus 2]